MDFVTQLDDKIRGLSTSQVAALIAFGTFAIQLLLSFVWPLILIAFISERESAVTWSVVGRVIHNSYWPTVLQTDATATSGVRKRVSAVSYGVVLASLLVGIAGVVTPLGLHDGIVLSNDQTPVPFQYSPDASALGLGTTPRHGSLGFSRICFSDDFVEDFGLVQAACPNSHQNQTIKTNGTDVEVDSPDGYDTRVPRNVYEFFQSGVSRLGRTVSSIFDIEYRTYRTENDTEQSWIQSDALYLIGDYRQLTSVALNDRLEAVEGLIVDTKNGGVGFRNHTIPAENLGFGAQWTEDILFIEPVTECTNLNITLEYNIAYDDTRGEVGNLSLVDRGGFVDISRPEPEYDAGHSQDDPELAYRAYIGARVINLLTMYYLNITNPQNETLDLEPFAYLDSEDGRAFPLPADNRSNTSEFELRSISIGYLLESLKLPISYATIDPTAPLFESFIPPNPWQISAENFTDSMQTCRGALVDDPADIDHVAGRCGLVKGMPQRSDGSDTVLMEPGSEWTVPLYNCASASRAIIKTVSFSINNTADLSGLEVLEIKDKEYGDSSEYPIWAVEDTGLPLENTNPLWGLAESEEAPFPNMSFKRAPHLWLAGFDPASDQIPKGEGFENLPGLYFYSMAFVNAYFVGPGGPGEGYNGEGSLPMYNRWKELTRTTEGAAKVIDLIWTDVAANSVVGTRGQMPRGEPNGLGPAYEPDKAKGKRAEPASSEAANLVPIYIYNREVQYRIPYAIPAFIVLGLVLGVLALSITALVSRRAGPARIRWFLTRLSAGRLMTTPLVSGDGDVSPGQDKSAKDMWLHGPGKVKVDISGVAPRVGDGVIKARGRMEGKGVAPGLGINASSSMLEEDRARD